MYTYSQTHTHTARTHPPNRLPHTHTYTHGAHEHTEENPTTDMEDVTVADTKGKTKKRRMPAKTPTAQKPKRRAPITVKVPCVWVYAHSCVCARVHARAHIHCAKTLMLID